MIAKNNHKIEFQTRLRIRHGFDPAPDPAIENPDPTVRKNRQRIQLSK